MSQTGAQLGRDTSAIPPFQPDGALKQLASQIKSGECVLFLGAGVHAPPPQPPSPVQSSVAGVASEAPAAAQEAPSPQALQAPAAAQGAAPAPFPGKYDYPVQERPLLGGDLSEKLADECDYRSKFPHESPRDLQRVSLCFEKSPGLGRAKLVDRLNQFLMSGKKPSPILKMLAGMPFRIIVTTNYDRLMDAALRTAGKDPNIVIYDPTPETPTRDVTADPSKESPLVFKMHGDLTQKESIVITDEDYITFVQRLSEKDNSNPVPLTIRYRMQKWSTLFLGYSLRDYNLRLLFRTLRWRVDPANFPPSFSIDRNPDLLILQVYQNERQFITFVAEDLWSSVPYLYQAVTGKEFDQ